jgi:hypothetical protein
MGFQRRNMKVMVEFSGSGKGSIVGFCEYVDETYLYKQVVSGTF